jgi:hypothetical protein
MTRRELKQKNIEFHGILFLKPTYCNTYQHNRGGGGAQKSTNVAPNTQILQLIFFPAFSSKILGVATLVISRCFFWGFWT